MRSLTRGLSHALGIIAVFYPVYPDYYRIRGGLLRKMSFVQHTRLNCQERNMKFAKNHSIILERIRRFAGRVEGRQTDLLFTVE